MTVSVVALSLSLLAAYLLLVSSFIPNVASAVRIKVEVVFRPLRRRRIHCEDTFLGVCLCDVVTCFITFPSQQWNSPLLFFVRNFNRVYQPTFKLTANINYFIRLAFTTIESSNPRMDDWMAGGGGLDLLPKLFRHFTNFLGPGVV